MRSEAWSKMEVDYPNIKVRNFPAEVMEAMRAANQQLLIEKSAKNPMFKEILDSQKAYMKKARNWTRISDFIYLQGNL